MERHTNNNPPAMGSLPASPTTTFVQADTNTFRELVQKLTGANEGTPYKLPITLPARYSPASKSSNSGDLAFGPRRYSFKLQERRPNIRKLEIQLSLTSLHNNSSSSPRQTQTHLLDSPIQSPVTPVRSDTLFSGQFPVSGSSSPAASEEEKAIAEKGFYLHPSPLSTPRGSEQLELLPLFPLSSPKQQSEDQ
ncbi:VQ [Macleaya cordata]|uniref:VQ n=1 Tax=Macleaya cordata TaxID=56857 RepID=A0A200PPU8_MACCD|nr:VQ [Macleaya cordata]